MDSTWGVSLILLAGIVIVVGGILLFRLHAFLALILGALAVGLLTPRSAIERSRADEIGYRLSQVSDDGAQAEFVLDGKKPTVEAGMRCRVVRPWESGPLTDVALLEIRSIVAEKREDGTTRRRALGTLRLLTPPPDAPPDWDPERGLPLKADDVVLTPDAVADVRKLGRTFAMDRVASGFGTTCVSIGILIAMASIVGKCLLDSGGADRIVRSTLAVTGERGAPLAFAFSGFLLGIPVFFDTVFYLMIPLGKAMRTRTGRDYLLYVLTIVCGATMTHSLVPPTPGPLIAAQQLGVDLGMMILGGFVVGLFCSGYGLLHASIVNRRWELPLRETPDFRLADVEAIAQKDASDLPPLGLSLLPILLPVALIGGETVVKSALAPAAPPVWVSTLGDKNVALILSAAIGLFTLVRYCRKTRDELAAAVESALTGAGTVILITAAGGAFGTVLKQTNVAGLLRELPSGSPLLLLGTAFLITVAVRTAQGSATVAMITAGGMFAGLAAAGGLGFHPVYLALAIGCGSKPVAWMNDSGFWVITRMSGMTEKEGLKYVTPMTSMMGVVGLIVVLIGATLFPLT